MARPRKPHTLRALEGGRGHSRPLTPDKPAPPDPLELPDGLSKEKREAWRKHARWVAALKLETRVDSGQMEALVSAYCIARSADRALEDGRIVEAALVGSGRGKKGKAQRLRGVSRRRAEVQISLDAWKQYSRIADKFGMSAEVRARMGAEPEKPPQGAGDVPAELTDADGAGA